MSNEDFFVHLPSHGDGRENGSNSARFLHSAGNEVHMTSALWRRERRFALYDDGLLLELLKVITKCGVKI